MKEELITFETAKLSREKGMIGGFVNDRLSSFYYYDEDKKLESLGVLWTENTLSKDVMVAPTQSLLQKWLREKHKIVVDVFQESLVNSGQYTGYWQVDISEVGNYKEEECPNPKILNVDFELALESGLLEALKLIKS